MGAAQKAILTNDEMPSAAHASPEKLLDDGAVSREFEIGLVFALSMEAAGIVDRLQESERTRGNGLTFYTGNFTGHRVVVVETGIGESAALRGAELLLDLYRPKRLLSAGYAGGLTKRLGRNELVIPSRFVRLRDGALLESVDGAHTDSSQYTLLTSERVIRTPGEKRDLGKRFGADMVDMESWALAEFARRHGIPFLSLRIILDTIEEELASDVQRIVDNSTNTARMLGSVVGALFRRPSSLLDLYHLKERALVATDRLAIGIAELLKKTADD